MATKLDQIVILPSDTGNTGKKVRTKEHTVGGNVVQEYFFIPSSERKELGNYKFSSGAQAIPTAVHTGTTTAFLFLINPLGSTVNIAIDRLTMLQIFSTTLALDLIAPIIRISRLSFTGTLSATPITPCKRATADAAAQGLISLASTGLTVTNVATMYEFLGRTRDLATGSAGCLPAQTDEFNPANEGDELILVPGEGISIWSTLAVTTANRKLIINGCWKEFS